MACCCVVLLTNLFWFSTILAVRRRQFFSFLLCIYIYKWRGKNPLIILTYLCIYRCLEIELYEGSYLYYTRRKHPSREIRAMLLLLEWCIRNLIIILRQTLPPQKTTLLPHWEISSRKIRNFDKPCIVLEGYHLSMYLS